MDLKIKDVAELLHVSETTIRRLLKSGKIPAYQLNRQYRFSRGEIEDWMMKCRLKPGQEAFHPFEERVEDGAEHKNTEGTQQYSLYRAMFKGGVISDIASTDKQELIAEVMQKCARRLKLDPDIITELLLDREALMPTAFKGIAIPHPRDTVLEMPGSDTIITVFPRTPVDYQAFDGHLVHTIFFLFSTSDKSHLHLLAKLAHLGSSEFLVCRPSQDDLLHYIKQWEANVRNKKEYT